MLDHDAMHPAKGVSVLPVPMQGNYKQLSLSQQKQRRTWAKDTKGNVIMGVLRPQRQGGPVGIGMVPCAQCTPVPEDQQTVYYRQPQHKTPGKKHFSGTSCSAPANPIFQGKIPTENAKREAEGLKALNILKTIHAKVYRREFNALVYLSLRIKHLRAFPEHEENLKHAEALHRGRAGR